MDKSDVQTLEAENNLKTSQDGIPGDLNLKLTQPNDLPPYPAVAHDNKLSPQIDPANSQAPVASASEEQSNSKVVPHGQNSNPASHPADADAHGDDTNNDHPNVEGPVEAELRNTVKGQEDSPAAETESKDLADPRSPAKDQSRSEDGKEVNKDTHSSTFGGTVASENAEGEGEVAGKVQSHIGELPFELPVSEVPPKKKEALNDANHQSESEEIAKGPAEDILQSGNEGLVNGQRELENKSVLSATKPTIKSDVADSPSIIKRQPATPDFPLRYSSRRSRSHGGETFKRVFNDAKMAENDDGTPEEQATFIKELENFYRQRGGDFKPPKFYGQPLNCYKLWTSVIKLGGYDLVTATKLWRQVGESFHPPKTCTTVSWTFRIFYEKSLLEYERYKVQNDDVELPAAALPEPSGADNEGNGLQASGSGRARRDAAARAMQGWHAQRILGYGEDKSPNSMPKRENKIKSIGSLKQKRPNEAELPVKAQKTETYKQLVTTVVDVGPPADWVKINVREIKDCFEVYALVPGLLREEVRVQSDPAGRLVITGQPEQTDNPWGITAFKKVVNLPARIDPLQTSAVVSLHGRLFVRVPFEQSNV